MRPGDLVLTIPGPLAPDGRVVVAKPEAIALAAYLISLNRQYPVPASAQARDRVVTGAADDVH